MPVAVGVLVAVIFLISFSGWFYHIAAGWNEYVLDDVYFKYRIAAASLISIAVITATFFGLAYAAECPGESGDDSKQGIFSSLNCADYRNIKVGAESLFKKSVVKQEESIPAEDAGELIFQ